ncbi:putative membrane protein [Motilibacter rhizosphaerae]|uniref:Putative membrane protein n=1 Tax=Motilibacter rhizosphaerae TaxID=598652 RepID=A0A4V2F4K3_9ACTN|nr:YibE/F family protein [Motilibacter rhizosphaerae]RZS89619.1 putative membrane protein [Motilibacter rhizosphaerae]
MGGAHAHSGGRRRAAPPPARAVLLLVAVLVPLAGLTVAGLVHLWPRADPATYLPAAGKYAADGVTTVSGTVTDVEPYVCTVGVEGDDAATRTVVCAHLVVRLTSGPEKGRTAPVDATNQTVDAGVSAGTRIQLLRLPADQVTTHATYTFGDFTRGTPLVVLAAVFAVLVVAVARLRGLLALAGLVLAFGLVVEFVLPAVLIGRDPLLVGVVASAAIVFVVLYLAHGISVRTSTALVGTLFGLGAAAGLARVAVHAAHLTGVSSDDDLTVGALAGNVHLPGLLLCGIVIGTLGVLNDVTVTQASAVWELHEIAPGTSAARLFAGGMRIGRDHIASTVYTIAFAYAGASLPVLLLIELYQRPLAQTLTSSALAQEIVSTLVGAVSLVLAVPLTTAVGVLLVKASGRRPAAGTAGD